MERKLRMLTCYQTSQIFTRWCVTWWKSSWDTRRFRVQSRMISIFGMTWRKRWGTRTRCNNRWTISSVGMIWWARSGMNMRGARWGNRRWSVYNLLDLFRLLHFLLHLFLHAAHEIFVFSPSFPLLSLLSVFSPLNEQEIIG